METKTTEDFAALKRAARGMRVAAKSLERAAAAFERELAKAMGTLPGSGASQ